MATLIAGVVAVIVIYSLLQMFRAANPVILARVIKMGGGVVLLAVAAFTGLRGELAVAIPLGIFGAGLLGWSPFGTSGFSNIGGMFGAGAKRSAGQTSKVRSQFLDMTLDHDSGELSGQIVAGPFAGHDLGEFDLAQLTAMISGFDAESVALFESYLDRRFPAWRQDAQGDAARGESRAASSGKMTDEEAYQILGLQPGASRDDIGRAHRADEETASRPGGVYVSRRPCEPGQGYFASHAFELTPATPPNATNRSCFRCSLFNAPWPPAVVRHGRSFVTQY